MIRDALITKYNESIKDSATRKRYKVAISGSERKFTAWIKVPSEKYDLDYDVILELEFEEGVRAVMGANVRLYCNSPGWFMPVGYVAAQSGLLIPGWKKALGRAAVEKPSTINPHGDYGFDKTTFRAILFLTGIGGYVTITDLLSSSRGAIPNPSDPALSAEAKLFQYGRAKDKHDLAQKVVKKAVKAASDLDAAKKRSEAKGAAGAAKSVKAAASVKSGRQAGNATRKKAR